MTGQPARAPALPVISACTLFIMSSLTCLLSFLPLRIQGVISSFMVGGLFGLMVPPVVMLHSTLMLLKAYVPFLPSYRWLYAAILATYVVSVNMLDKTAVKPLKVSSKRNEAREGAKRGC